MGVKGLATLLRPVLGDPIDHLTVAAGKTVGYDLACFLHSMVSWCNSELVLHSNTGPIVTALLKYIDRMLSRKVPVVPVFVLDSSRPYPPKRGTGAKRSKSRLTARHIVAATHAQGIIPEAGALRNAASVPNFLKVAVVQALRAKGYKVIVAPYEADAQLAHMALTKEVDFIWSLDSDLLVYLSPNLFLATPQQFPMARHFKSSEVLLTGMQSHVESQAGHF